MTTREDRIHNVRDFLQRPIVIRTGLWASSVVPETTGAQLYTANFPEVLISNSMYQEKLRGFVGLRATLVIKVQVNSQPFQQGRLLLQYFPYAQYMQSRVEIVNKTLQGRSGCPRTDLDISMGTEIEMRIPYVSPHVYYNLITGQGSFGAIYLNVYSQLRDQVSGTGSIEYTVWAHMEDVDVQYPTGAAIFTGSSPNFSNLANKLASGKMTGDEVRDMYSSSTYKEPPAAIFAQAGLELTQLKNNNSPSQGIGQISEGLSTLSRIPIIGNMFTKPAWISAAAANIFKHLGYSKPTVQGLPCESKLRGQTRMANYDGADTSHKLALSSSNEIETKSGLSGTSSDEMALSHVLSIPNFWDKFIWPSTGAGSASGSVLWDNFVTPFKVKNFSSTVTNIFRTTHMGYVANSFGLWRGSIVYTFKFVKTQFHSGRLQISFIPFYYNSTISTGVPDTSKAQRMIVDLRTSTEVSFTVPYVSSRPWMHCIRPESSWLGTNNAKMFNAVTGIIRVEVLNKLVAFNNVFPSIETIVEVHGGPDLTFANPTCPSYIPYGGAIAATTDEASANEIKQEYSVRPIAQTSVMGANEAIPRNDAQKGVHPDSIDTHIISSNWSPEANCIGEKIMSIRQLIKRFGQFNANSITLNSDPTAATAFDSIALAPFSHQIAPTSTTSVTRRMTQLDYYYYLYAFWRGSMRYKLISETTENVVPTSPAGRKKSQFSWDISMFSSLQDTMNTIINLFSTSVNIIVPFRMGNSINNSVGSNIIVDPSVEGVVEFEVPYYNISHISPGTQYSSTDRALNVDNILRGHIPPCAVILRPRTAPSTDNVVFTTFWRAPGDDFSLSYLVGVPPLVNLSR
uniref:Putative ORF2 n=1 Tax=Caledonia beadlet anemone dicistro-like virus 2 TaxID=2021908 RepID=A0A221LFD4_9VIRU|nr:putative ORF2 [Caledonia beadlet anemone dicistro-like virus 2]